MAAATRLAARRVLLYLKIPPSLHKRATGGVASCMLNTQYLGKTACVFLVPAIVMEQNSPPCRHKSDSAGATTKAGGFRRPLRFIE
jgi:hypothetical protein